jgi:hypothetical protein
MTQPKFNNIIKNPHTIDRNTFEALQDLLKTHPYFQIGFTLVAKYLHDHTNHSTHAAIQKAAIYATDRRHLKNFLETPLNPTQPSILSKSITNQVHAPNPSTTLPIPATQTESPTIPLTDPPSPATPSQEQKQPKRKINLNQTNIIENFIKKGNQWRAISNKELYLEEEKVDLTESSTTWQDTLSTESLARVMLQQGNLKRANDIYKALQLKFPEKKAYFSNLLEEKTTIHD